LANNVNHGKVYEVSDWGESPAAHIKSIIAFATTGLQALVRLTIDSTKILIDNIKLTIDKTISI
tara:strand:+ start:2026 stop:2217 length:192 start_codon:yes stop_codon:yes gene_type:complete